MAAKYKTREEFLSEWEQKGFRFSEADKAFLSLSEEEQSDPKTFAEYCELTSGGWAIALSSEKMRDNRELMLIAAKDGVTRFFYLISERLRDDPEIALYAAQYGNNGGNGTCGYISHRLRDDPEFVLEAIKVNSEIYKYATVKVKTDPDILMYVAENDPSCLEYILKTRKVAYQYREKILNDKMIMLAVAKSSPEYLFELFPRQNLVDPDIIEAAFHISDKNECRKVLKKNPWAIAYVPIDIWGDDEKLILDGVKQDGSILQYLPDELRDNEKVVRAAIREDSEGVLEFASSRLRDDYDFVLRAVKVDPLNLEFASDRLKDDRTIVFAAVKIFGGALVDASERLKHDPELIKLYVASGYEEEDLFE